MAFYSILTFFFFPKRITRATFSLFDPSHVFNIQDTIWDWRWYDVKLTSFQQEDPWSLH